MKVLVTAASRHGSTAEIATIVAGILQASDIDAEVLPPEAVASVVDYDAVILGSAVYAGEWLEPARAFVARHADDLATRPVFLFSSGPLGYPSRRPVEPADAVAVELMTGAIDLQVFPGRLVGRELDLRERLFATKTHVHTATSAHGTTSSTGRERSSAPCARSRSRRATRVGRSAPGDPDQVLPSIGGMLDPRHVRRGLGTPPRSLGMRMCIGIEPPSKLSGTW